MQTLPPSPQVIADPHSVTDHQRTYEADAALHGRLLASVGLAIAPQDGQRHVVRRGIGPVVLDRTLVSWYFDTEQLDLFHSGAMLRCRGRQTSDGEPPTLGLLEARVPNGSEVRRVKGSDHPFQQHIANPADATFAGVRHLTNGQPVRAVAAQVKVRTLLFLTRGVLERSHPDIVLALDEVRITSLVDPTKHTDRREVELQLFTKTPWTRRVDGSRLSRFAGIAASIEETFALAVAETASYQAVPEELLS